MNNNHTSEEHTLKVFLCHAHEDKVDVRVLYFWLKAMGIDVWLDEENLIAGQEFDLEIQKALENSDVVIVCLSQTSTSRAGYINKEIKIALDMLDRQPEGAPFLIPVRLENTTVPTRLKHLHWVDLFEERGYELLIKALEHRASDLNLRLLSLPEYSSFAKMNPSKEEERMFRSTGAAISAWRDSFFHAINGQLGIIRVNLYWIKEKTPAKIVDKYKFASEIDDIDKSVMEILTLLDQYRRQS